LSRRDFAVPAAIGIGAAAGATLGISFPLTALNMDDWGVSPSGIGFATLAAALSTLVATPLVPPVLARAPVRLVIAMALLAIAAAFVTAHFVRDYWAWMGTRTVIGAGFTFLFVSSEAWILERARPERRGLVIGVYASTLAGAMAAGGLVIAAVGHQGAAPFFVAAGLAVGALLFLALPAAPLTAPEGHAARPAALIARIASAPAVMLGPFIMGAIETAKYNLVPIYARRVGLGDEVAAGMITASGVGVLLLQPLIGLAADRFGVRPALVFCALAGVAAPLAVAAVGAAPTPALALMVVYSGLVTGLYTVGLVALARRFSGGDLAAANAAYAFSYGAGQLFGPAVAGPAFDIGGPAAFMAALALFSGVYLAGLAATGRRKGEAADAPPAA
jgi:MFS family permease